MEILKNFGVDPILLGAQILNILLLFFLLKKFLYKPLLKMMQDRKLRIEEGLTFTQDAEKRLAKIKEEETKILKIAQTQAQKMLTETKKQTATLLKEAEEHSRAQTEKMIKDAHSKIAEESKEAEQRIAKKVTLLAMEYLRKSVSQLFDEKEQKEIMARAVKELKPKN